LTAGPAPSPPFPPLPSPPPPSPPFPPLPSPSPLAVVEIPSVPLGRSAYLLARYTVALSSDSPVFGGHNRVQVGGEYFTEPMPKDGRQNSVLVSVIAITERSIACHLCQALTKALLVFAIVNCQLVWIGMETCASLCPSSSLLGQLLTESPGVTFRILPPAYLSVPLRLHPQLPLLHHGRLVSCPSAFYHPSVASHPPRFIPHSCRT